MTAALASLIVLLTAGAGFSMDFPVADFGATGDGKTDDGPAIRKAVEAAVAAGPGSRVTFEQKIYRLDWSMTSSYQISLEGAENISIEGNGAVLVSHPRNNLISLGNCTGVSVKGFTVDCDPLPFTQGTIIEVNAKEGWLDFRIQQGYRHPVDEYESIGLNPPMEDWGVVFDPAERHRRWDVDMHFFMREFIRSPVGEDIARVFFLDESKKDLAKVRPGDRYVITFKYGNSGANNELSGCDNCRFDDFTFHMAKYGMTFAVVNSRSRNVFSSVKIAFKPGSDRLIVTPKDGFHCKDNRVGPLIEECLQNNHHHPTMNPRIPYLRNVVAAALLPVLITVSDAGNSRGKKPNILLVITDDQGYGDISAHGNPILKTPHLDQLRAESVRFDDFHVSPTCAPTRSALFTGRHEFMNGITHTILERERLAPGAITLAQVLRDSGYATGIFGKWHLGDEAAYQPEKRGFDEVFIHGAGGIGQSYQGSCGDAPGNKYFDPVILHNGKFVRTSGYCTDVFFGQAKKWIHSQKEAGKPFFAYIPTNAPHKPYIARAEDAAIYRDKAPDRQTAHFYGMIHNIDENIGKLLQDLRAMGIERDTVVVFINDNGTAQGENVFNAGMRGKKGTPWLGGTRVSSFWRWPGTWKPGASKALTAHIDIFPTLAQVAGVDLTDEANQQIEGRSLMPLLENPAAAWADRHIFTHVGRWPKFADPDAFKFANAAVRNTRWSLVSDKGGNTADWKLYDLLADYGQKTDVAAQHPEIVKELTAAFDQWWARCRPMMVNEMAVGPELNAFAVRYWEQFGGEPTEARHRRMKPGTPGNRR